MLWTAGKGARKQWRRRRPAGSPRNRPALLLGRYEVGKLLGQGNFAKVYHARNVHTGEEVAIKVMEKEKIFKSGLMAHIKRDRRVRHPHIVQQLYEVMATKLRIYFVMEYVRGGELFARGRLREADARRYFQQLVSSVAFCHARGVYHRDIKPENLLLDDAGDLKVSDFGLSAVLSRRGYDAAKADLWSCGVVLAAGYLPFQDRNLVAMYRKIHRGEFRCPKWFSPELTRLLDTNPQRRATANEIMDDEWFKVGFRRFSFRIEDDRSFTFFDLDGDDGVHLAGHATGSRHRSQEGEKLKGAAGGLTSCASVPSLLQLESRSRLGGSSRRRSSLNAFDMISFSRGFDLSGLFEDGEGGSVLPEQPPHPTAARFVSAAPVEQILATLKGAASAAGMVVRERDDGSISMEGTREGEHGALAVAAEIYELTPELLVVEVRRKSGGAAVRS
ncbi:hypothetical protein PVAP13_9NG331219 [Panicum virgatum]|uniref:non-specific serine/threonine protein kinase n=1 Tax=Panicum virgatum TaxID=38727 RepID=A0A8T0MN26_PANVG|nr:hypothetical protein PVAP13_9NG331219 [Panicum virgatum]